MLLHARGLFDEFLGFLLFVGFEQLLGFPLQLVHLLLEFFLLVLELVNFAVQYHARMLDFQLFGVGGILLGFGRSSGSLGWLVWLVATTKKFIKK